MNTILRRCEYCHKSIEHRKSSAKTCGNTCKQYAMEVRQGKREPVPSPDKENEPGEGMNPIDMEVLQKEFEVINESHKMAKMELEELKEELIMDSEPVQNAIMKHFNLLKTRNDFIKKHFLKGDEISGTDVVNYSNTITRYPFADLNHILFCHMGKPMVPFLSLILGGKNTGKSILSALISKELISVFDAKVLHVVDSDNKNTTIGYYSHLKMESKNLTIKLARNFDDIINALKKDEYEFLIIDSIEGVNISYHQIKRIQSAHNNLSVFCITRRQIKSLADAADISFQTETYSTDYSNGAMARIFVNGNNDEDQQCGIFINNEIDNFSINL